MMMATMVVVFTRATRRWRIKARVEQVIVGREVIVTTAAATATVVVRDGVKVVRAIVTAARIYRVHHVVRRREAVRVERYIDAGLLEVLGHHIAYAVTIGYITKVFHSLCVFSISSLKSSG
jgi:hypothetical protein